VQYQAQQFTTLQTVYAQNKSATENLIVVAGLGGQQIIFPPLYAGYVPILAPIPPKLAVLCNDTAITDQPVFLLNFQIPPIMWNTNA